MASATGTAAHSTDLTPPHTHLASNTPHALCAAGGALLLAAGRPAVAGAARRSAAGAGAALPQPGADPWHRLLQHAPRVPGAGACWGCCAHVCAPILLLPPLQLPLHAACLLRGGAGAAEGEWSRQCSLALRLRTLQQRVEGGPPSCCCPSMHACGCVGALLHCVGTHHANRIISTGGCICHLCNHTCSQQHLHSCILEVAGS